MRLVACIIAASLSVIVTGRAAAAEPSDLTPAPKSTPRLALALDASAGSLGVARLEVSGTAGIRALEAISSDGFQSTIEILDLSGSPISSVTTIRPVSSGERIAPMRILDSGREVAPARAALTAPVSVGRVLASKREPTTTLTWRDRDGTTLTVMMFGETALELTPVAPAAVGEPSTARDATPDRPFTFEVLPAPHASDGASTFRFSVPQAGRVTIAIFDVMGRRLTRVLDQERAAGLHSVDFQADALPRGRYFVRLSFTSSTGALRHSASRSLIRL